MHQATHILVHTLAILKSLQGRVIQWSKVLDLPYMYGIVSFGLMCFVVLLLYCIRSKHLQKIRLNKKGFRECSDAQYGIIDLGYNKPLIFYYF